MTATLRRSGIAAIVLLALLAAAIWVSTRDQSARISSALLYPELAAQLPTIERLQLFTANEQLALEIFREGERWSVTQRAGYPADVGKLGVLLQSLAELRVIEAKTADPALYPALAVNDVSAPDADGVRLRVTATDSAPVVNLIVGKGAAGMQATYVRKTEEAQSYLVSQLEINRTPGAWISSTVLHIDTDRIHQASIHLAGQREVGVVKSGRDTRYFASTGKPLIGTEAANGVAAALIAIESQDVRRSEELANVPPAASARYRMFDGLELALTGWKDNNERWITVAPSFNSELANRFANDKRDDTSAFWRTPEQAQQEAQRLTGRLSGWAFRIPDYRYDSIFPDAEKWLLREP